MINVIEESFDIDVYDKVKSPVINQKLNSSQCIMGGAQWSEPITMFIKVRLGDWFKYLLKALLY
ncbi:hypothetical protein J6TS7_65720 [Paenibacillus dendritiformis]|nr:hypothetical protein J6TS7_65720 [Paenibacillus dendritiformis]